MDIQMYWLGFSMFPSIGPKRLKLLMNVFGSIENAWNAEQKLLEKYIGKVTAAKFVRFKATFNSDLEQQKLEKNDVFLVPLNSEQYPPLLKEVENAPFVLYVKGSVEVLQTSSVAIVGTRRVTQYGQAVTTTITKLLVQGGYTIVSGLAYGVDAIAHLTTINNDGKTIAVLGSGVDYCYPHANQKIYDAILSSSGAIISEFPIGMPPSVGSFPSRNRIIAGLAKAVIVTEGAEDSGALYTADEGFRLGRKVFAVPGPITSPLSKGPLSLVTRGAILVTDVEDVLKNIAGVTNTSTKKIIGDTEEEQTIVSRLENESLPFDGIVKILKKDPAYIAGLLSIMEMKGQIKCLDDGSYTPAT